VSEPNDVPSPEPGSAPSGALRGRIDRLSAPIGTRDLLPPLSTRFRQLVQVFDDVVSAAGYGQVVPPMFEDLAVFKRVGEATDVVTKEMYDFEDKGGRRIALRPEQTASICRAFVEHRPQVLPWKTWYAGPNFRYEKPQKGRYRQFDQVGIEALGSDDPLLDVEVIALAQRFYDALGLSDVTLSINSLGDDGDRAAYSEALRSYFTANLASLSDQSKDTLSRNPLRVLDSKRPEDADLVAAAPQMSEFLSPDAAEAFAAVQRGLRLLDIDFVVSPRLVRGLDYYRRSTFEFASTAIDSAQNAVGGGGRYDGLVESLGGPPTPGVGFALGVDRILLACDAEGVFGADASATIPIDVYVIDTTDGAAGLVAADQLRSARVRTDRAFGGGSMKSQMKRADRSGASVAVLFGSDEVAAGTVTVRPLRGGEQVTVARYQLIDTVTRFLP
jgi:histidyl-tRNA synthetase